MLDTDLFGKPIIEPVEVVNTAIAHMQGAKDAGDDEFYTRRADIEEELQHYEHHFKGKVVYCNCDDPEWSQFYKYFSDNYDRLGLFGLHTNHYDPATGKGDFRSAEARAKLERADIVVTNPPFTLFRHLMTQLIEANPDRVGLIAGGDAVKDKKFLIIGFQSAITYDCVFPLLQSGQMWLGVKNKPMTFDRPDGTTKAVPITWFTNLSHYKRAEFIKTPTKFADMKRVKYDNFDAIDCKYLKNLPSDYDGVMGVPITFMGFHNPAQFEVLGKRADLFIDGKQQFNRIIIRKVKP